MGIQTTVSATVSDEAKTAAQRKQDVNREIEQKALQRRDQTPEKAEKAGKAGKSGSVKKNASSRALNKARKAHARQNTRKIDKTAAAAAAAGDNENDSAALSAPPKRRSSIGQTRPGAGRSFCHRPPMRLFQKTIEKPWTVSWPRAGRGPSVGQ